MDIDIVVPALGESITKAVLTKWLKDDGATVPEGDDLFELETEKAAVAFPSPAPGVLSITVPAGSEVEVGAKVAVLKAAAAQPPRRAAAEPVKAAPPLTAEAVPAAPAAGAETASDGRPRKRVAMTPIRKKTAERLVRAKQNTAYLTTFNEVDMTKVMQIRSQYREEFEKEHGIKIGFTSFYVKAACQALKQFAVINSVVDGDDMIYQQFYDIGVAVSIDAGLIVPVIRNADRMSFAEIEGAIASLAKRAREKKLLPDELSGGTFTITNGGVFGSLLSTPIPVYPQTAILGLHAIKPRPVVVDNQIVIRPMMYVALTYDHRVVDGREAIGFLCRIKDFVEEPDKLLLEM